MIRTTGKELVEQGLALVLYNITENRLTFAFGDERLDLRYANMTDEKPNRCIPFFEYKGARVAKIEDVRKAAELQK